MNLMEYPCGLVDEHGLDQTRCAKEKTSYDGIDRHLRIGLRRHTRG